MNSELPLTRRDVVALVMYMVIAYNTLSPLLNLVSQLVLSRVPGLQSTLSFSGARLMQSLPNFGMPFVLSLAFMPFISLIAAGATGRKSSQVMTKRIFFPVIFTCTGLMLLMMWLPQFGTASYLYLAASTVYGSSASTLRPYFLHNIASACFGISIGFAIAFFPTIFDTLRSRVRGEESAA